MLESVRVLLAGIVDYAGLFPPAKLPMDHAVRNYLRYRTEPDSWMLGRFICPAARLHELRTFADDIGKLPGPLSLSLLGRGGANAKEFSEGVRADIADALKLRAHLGDRIAVETYEMKLPAALCQPSVENELFALVRATSSLWQTEWQAEVMPFYEPPSASRQTIEVVAGVLARHALPQLRCCAGLKIRCGGIEPTQLPTTDQLAFAIARNRGALRFVPLKFTAGLHHPFRHFDNATQAEMHGFLSLFAAGVLAYDYPLLDMEPISEIIMQQIIADANPLHFRFTDLELAWNDVSAPLLQVAMARQVLVTSFGSCSFDEPRDDLRALGLIP